MAKNRTKKNKRAYLSLFKKKGVIVPSIVLLALATLYFGTFGVLNIAFARKIMPGAIISGVKVGGMTKEEATKALGTKASEIYKKGILIGEKDNKDRFTISAEEIGLKYNLEKTIDRAILWNKLNLNLFDFFKRDLAIDYEFDEKRLEVVLERELSKINIPATESKVKIKKGQILFTDEKEGEGIEPEKLKRSIKNAIQDLRSEILVSKEVLLPKITKDILEKHKDEIEKALDEPLLLLNKKKTYEVNKEILADWIEVEENDNGFLISFSRNKILDYLKGLAPRINKPTVNARLKIENGRATIFNLSQDGETLKIEESANKILKEIKKNRKIELVIEITKAEVNEENIEKLGIKELIATGYSDFAGSPQNRIHNIKMGASKFNGALIKPDEDFSFNTILGPVESSTGFLPELVILQNKTVPQYGGGLCQVSTTAFRAALNAGLPIIARTAHAYPVKYYKPYGVDATIYLPKPDLKFKNDTGSYILIQTRIEGTKLFFDFYGAKKKELVKFAGNSEGIGAVPIVEQVTAYTWDQGYKGNGSFRAVFYRLTYNEKGELIKRDKFSTNYDSPDNYPKTEPNN